MIKLYLFLFSIIPLHVFCQDLEWIVTAGGENSDKATTIAVDSEKNSYITGYVNHTELNSGNAQFGPHQTTWSSGSFMNKEAFVAKLDSNGNYLWVRNGLNYYDDRGLGLCLDPQGNVFITGTCWGDLEWESLPHMGNSTDQIFVIKLDSNGNEIWKKTAGNTSIGTITAWWDSGQTLYNDDHGFDIASDSQGNLFVTGYISSVSTDPASADFDAISIPLQYGDTLGYVAKLSNNGDWQWVRTFEGVYMYRDNAIGIDDEDNVYVAGGFKGTRTFESDVLTSVNESLDIFVTKYDNSGNYQFTVQAGDSLDDRADGITYGQDNHMYVTGEFRGEIYFGTDDLNNYGDPEDKDIFVSKMTKNGQWIWATKAGSKKGGDRGIGICANDQGNIFVSGQFRDDAKFGELDVIAAEADTVNFYVGCIDSSGVWMWVLSGGGPWKDRAASIACDNDCNVYFTGFFKDQMNVLGTNYTSTGRIDNDIFVGKISDACKSPTPPDQPNSPSPPIDYSGFVPTNVFTPNNDGINDVLYFGNTNYTSSELVILNRWGNPVFKSNNVNAGWDGKCNSGNYVTEGTYFYTIQMTFEDGTEVNKSGFVSLLFDK